MYALPLAALFETWGYQKAELLILSHLINQLILIKATTQNITEIRHNEFER